MKQLKRTLALFLCLLLTPPLGIQAEEPQTAKTQDIQDIIRNENARAIASPGDSFAGATDMVLDETYPVEVNDGEHKYFKFTPKEDGIYIFSSNNRKQGDPFGRLYDCNGIKIAENDDGEDGLDFSIQHCLNKGETYYLEAEELDNSSAVFHVSVIKKAAEEGIHYSANSNVRITYGETAILRVDAFSTRGRPLSYQWYAYDSANENNTLLNGQTEKIYEIPAESKYTQYLCRISDGTDENDIAFFITFDTGLTASSNTGTDEDGEESSSSYRHVSLENGETITLEVTAAGGIGELSYQWYHEDYADPDYLIDGATGNTLTITAGKNISKYYYCQVSDGLSQKGVTFYVTVNTGLTASSSTGTDYDQMEENSSHRLVKAAKGSSVTLSVNAKNNIGGITYAWKYYNKSEDTWDNLPQAANNSYSFNPQETGEYQCQISDGVNTITIEFLVMVDVDYNWDKNTSTLTVSGTGVIPYGILNFSGCRSSRPQNLKIIIADGITGIESWALFANWYGTDKTISCDATLPASVTYLGSRILGAYDYDTGEVTTATTTIRCYQGSAAEKYAKDNNITIEYLSGSPTVNLKSCSIAISPESSAYTGAAITPKATVSYNGKTLAEGTDYSLSYANNVNVGKGTVTITGKGTYTGTITKEFTITSQSINGAIVSLSAESCAYTGSAQTPAVTVKVGNRTLAAGTDYQAAYQNNTNIGTASVTITGKGNYTGTVTKKFTITPQSLSKAIIALSSTKCSYNGKPQKPPVTVKIGNKTLAAGTDYQISYQNNINIGTASVTITGKGNYTGTATASFTIAAKKGSSYTIGAYKYKVTGTSQVAFTGLKNSKTKNVSIPKTVKIGKASFKVTSIAKNALKKSKVTSITIGDNVATIESSAFEGCSKLTKVTLGKGTAKIGANVFKNCKKLSSITVKSAKLKSVGKNALKGIKSNAKVKVPSKKLKSYQKLFKGKGQGKKVKIVK